MGDVADVPELVARVVPAIPVFSVDEGFRYAVPERLAARVGVGTMVRVPLGGRRVGGYVVAVESGSTAGLKPLAGISGSSAVFDRVGLDVARWAADHYLAPLSVMLGRTAPPNVPPPPGPTPQAEIPGKPSHRLSELAGSTHFRETAWLSADDPAEWVGALGSELARRGKSLVVIVPTGNEVAHLGRELSEFGDRAVIVPGDLDDSEATDAWERAAHHPVILVGTPRISMWHVGHPGVFAVLEESRRAMKDRQTPTVAVRDVVLERARRLRVPALFAGPTPSLDLMARRPRVVRGPGRVWPLVEVVDRHEDPPGGGLLAERTRQAIRITVNSGGAVFLFAHRRGYSAASRCASCRALRKCRSCGSRPDPGTECRRCGAVLGPCDSCGGARFEPLGAGVGRIVDEATRITGRGKTAEYPTTAPVMVGTERDLSDLEPMDLIVMVDADGLVFGTNYRAAEEALRIGARLAGRLRTGSGRRLIVQTNEPDNAVVAALRRGDPLDFGVVELVQRTRFGYPPAADLIVLEAKGGPPDLVDSELRKVARRAQVHGPAPADGANRWLIQGKIDLDTRRAFRPVLQRLRDSGFSLRVDVDPIDL